MKMRRHKVKHKKRAAKKFGKSVHRTKKANMRSSPMRGGWRF
jgi:hypothetical protein